MRLRSLLSRHGIRASLVIATFGLFTTPAVPDMGTPLPGKSPFLLRAGDSLQMLYMRGDEKSDQLYFQPLTKAGQPHGPAELVSRSIYDHGQNGPQLMSGPQGFSAVWNERTTGEDGSRIRFSRRTSAGWSEPITVNDDGLASSHSFQSAAISSDGTIYVAWLEYHGAGQDRQGTHPDLRRPNVTGGTTNLYMAIARDGGKSFEKNFAAAHGACPCCRIAIATQGSRVVLAFRDAQPGDIRDIWLRESFDGGRTWNAAASVRDDQWKLAGCAHQGPILQFRGDDLVASWFTQAAGSPGIVLTERHGASKQFNDAPFIHSGKGAAKLFSMEADERGVVAGYKTLDGAAVRIGKRVVPIPSQGTVTQISTAITGDRVLAAWSETVNDTASIHFQTFDRN